MEENGETLFEGSKWKHEDEDKDKSLLKLEYLERRTSSVVTQSPRQQAHI